MDDQEGQGKKGPRRRAQDDFDVVSQQIDISELSFDDEGSISRAPRGAGVARPTGLRAVLGLLRHDAPASVVVFLVALPLCLGIAQASEAPPLAGMITGIIGGILVGSLSGSPLAVSGPAAGLTVIVIGAIGDLGYGSFLLAVCLAGLIQIALGYARAGIIGYYFPSSVIHGMLAAIGVILVLKQAPVALGFDPDPEEYDFDRTMLPADLGHIHLGATVIAAVGLLILIFMGRSKRLKKLTWLPPPLVVVLSGIGINAAFGLLYPRLHIDGNMLVRLPGASEVVGALTLPEWGAILNPKVWVAALSIAVVASIETLLSVEAIDKLDPLKRVTPTNRELKAQGVGNLVAGLLGGLPLTAVIVRGSANVQAGAHSKVSAILHGVLLLLAVLLLVPVLNLIPESALAAILLFVGYRLAPLRLFRDYFKLSVEHWLPFLVTLIAILTTDLLRGVGIGFSVAVFMLLRAAMKTSHSIAERESLEIGGRLHIHLSLSDHVSFLSKAEVNRVLHELSPGSIVEIDARKTKYIHRDVLEIIYDFKASEEVHGVEVKLVEVPELENRIGGH